jgi:hypothetical protein
MKKLVFVLVATFSTVFSFSQDVITKSNGEEIKAKVLEVSQTEIKYKKFDNLNGPTFSISKNDVFMVKYENGSKDVFNTDRESKSSNGDTNLDAFEKGKRDARQYYKGQNSGAIWTGAAAAFTLPILGLIPALITTSAEPKEENLGIPDQKLFKDADYKSGYVQEAHKKKKKKVWTGFGIGTAFFALVVVILPVLGG